MDISIGQNLRQIRKKLGIRQHEITGEEITRNLISLIENDKTPLHERVAKLIVKNINEINEKKNVNFYIDYKDLLDPERFKAKEEADVFVVKLKRRLDTKDFNDLGQDIDEIEHYFEDWCILEKKAEIYELLGDIFYAQKDRISEYSYYTKAFESCFSLPYRKKKYELVLKLGASCIYLKKYEEAIRLNNLAINSFDICSEKVLSSLHYNSALAYKKMNRYDESLKCIQKAEVNIFQDQYTGLRVILILKANCYKDTQQYGEAIKIYNSLIPIFKAEKDYENLCIVYMNIIELYKLVGDKEKVLKYKNDAMELVEKVKKTSLYVVDIFFELGLALKYLEDMDLAEKYLLTALDYSELNTQDKKKADILTSLLDLYYITNKIEGIKRVEDKIMASKKELLDGPAKLILKLISLKLQHENVDVVKIQINKLLKEGNK